LFPIIDHEGDFDHRTHGDLMELVQIRSM